MIEKRRDPLINEFHQRTYVDSLFEEIHKWFNELTSESLSQSKNSLSPPINSIPTLDESTEIRLWESATWKGNKIKAYEFGNFAPNKRGNRLYQQVTDGEGSSRTLELTPDMIVLIEQMNMNTKEQMEQQQRMMEMTQMMSQQFENFGYQHQVNFQPPMNPQP